MKRQKPSCPVRARTAFACKNYYCFFSSFFSVSLAAGELGAGALLDPLAALPPGDALLLELGGVLGVLLAEPLALVEPPAAESFFVASADDEELEEDGGVLGTVAEPETELELEPDGAVLAEPDGVVVEPADDEEDAGGVVFETARSPSLSQPVSIPAPSARETATAKAESLICGPPWLGYKIREQGLGPCR